jgi:hypothetical protein
MAREVEYRLTVGEAKRARQAVQPNIKRMAEQVARDAAARSPRVTGRLAGGYKTEPGAKDPATTFVINEVPYARFVEFGSRGRPARPAFGRAIASFRRQWSA